MHAAGRKIYFHNNQYIACSPQKAKKSGFAKKEVGVFRFEPVLFTETDKNYIHSGTQDYNYMVNNGSNGPVFRGKLNNPSSPVKVFLYVNPDFNTIMGSVLSELLSEL